VEGVSSFIERVNSIILFIQTKIEEWKTEEDTAEIYSKLNQSKGLNSHLTSSSPLLNTTLAVKCKILGEDTQTETLFTIPASISIDEFRESLNSKFNCQT
jgi:hypothetical protein